MLAENIQNQASTLEQEPAPELIFIGRQPIYDANRQVVAYEILYRSGQTNAAAFVDGDQATAQTLVNGIINFGLDQIVGDKLAFINLTRNLLLQHERLPAMQGRVVLELLEDIEPEPQVVLAAQQLLMKGYTIALDDFIYHEKLRPLIALARYIKLELPKISPEDLPKHVELLRRFNLKLLAEKVETYEQFELCKSLGVDYFQGYFLSRPETISAKNLPVNKLAVVQILAKVNDPETTLDELERLVAADVALSYRIMRFVNSAQIALNCKVDTVRRAILMTGVQQIRAWVTLIVMARLDDKPPELLRIALLRSRLCEIIAKELGRPAADSYATAGLFSTLDALLDKPIAVILETLPLKTELAQALLDQSGPIGEVLRCVLSAERADWAPTIALGVNQARTSEILRQAIAWTEENSVHLSAKS